jgi:hypothetical protein
VASGYICIILCCILKEIFTFCLSCIFFLEIINNADQCEEAWMVNGGMHVS